MAGDSILSCQQQVVNKALECINKTNFRLSADNRYLGYLIDIHLEVCHPLEIQGGHCASQRFRPNDGHNR